MARKHLGTFSDLQNGAKFRFGSMVCVKVPEIKDGETEAFLAMHGMERDGLNAAYCFEGTDSVGLVGFQPTDPVTPIPEGDDRYSAYVRLAEAVHRRYVEVDTSTDATNSRKASKQRRKPDRIRQ